MGLYEAGIYMAAVQVCRVFPIFFDALNKAYVPWLFEKLSKDVFSEKVTVIKLTYGYILLLLLISIIVYFISPYLVLPILGDSYNEVASIIGYLAFGSCIQGIYYMFTNYIIYAKKTKVLSGITLASGLINILLSFLFIINYGLVGVCYAFIVANSLRITLTFIFASRYVNMPWYLFNGKN
jgi:O-antigen/teichoic acid export membrane protein